MANDKVTLRTKIIEPPVTGDEKMIHDPFKKKPKNPKVKMAKGGRVRSSCDGIAKKGKTKGRMV